MNKVVGAGKDRRLTELWSGARRRRRDLKMMVWVSRFLRWAAPRITARRGRLSRQEMNYAGEEENFAFPFFPPQSPRSVWMLSSCPVLMFCRRTVTPCLCYDRIPRAISTCGIQNQQHVGRVTDVNYPWGSLDPPSEIHQRSNHVVLLFGREDWSRWKTSSEHRVLQLLHRLIVYNISRLYDCRLDLIFLQQQGERYLR